MIYMIEITFSWDNFNYWLNPFNFFFFLKIFICLTNKSDMVPGYQLDEFDNYYWINYIEYEGQSMLSVQIKKGTL